jgi:hypothetical protein
MNKGGRCLQGGPAPSLLDGDDDNDDDDDDDDCEHTCRNV